MAIIFRCGCGKVMQAGEEHAGGRCQCVGCGKVLRIPLAAGSPTRAEAGHQDQPTQAQARQVSPAEKVIEQTDGVTTVPVPTLPPPPPLPAATRPEVMPHSPTASMLHGTEISGEAVPSAAAGWPAARTGTGAASQDAPGSFLGDDRTAEIPWYERDPRLRLRQSRRRTLLFASAGVVGVAVLGLVAWLLVSLFKGGAPASKGKELDPATLAQFDLVPRDAMAFATVRVADLWQSKVLGKVRVDSGAAIDKALRQHVGLALTDIERVTMVLAEPPRPGLLPDPPFWFVVHATKGFDAAALRTKIAPLATERMVGGKKVYVERDMALHFAGDREIWLGKPNAIEGILRGDRIIAKAGPLEGHIKGAADPKHHFLFAMHMPDAFRADLERQPDLPALARPFIELEAASLAFNADADGDLQTRLRFRKETAAKEALPTIQVALRGAHDEMRKMGGVGADERALLDRIGKLLTSATVDQKGVEVVVTIPRAAEALPDIIATLVRFIEVKGVPAPPLK